MNWVLSPAARARARIPGIEFREVAKLSKSVKPRVFRGLRDLLPEEMAARQRLIDTIRAVYESYGFAPLGTPAIEYLEVLTGSAAGTEAQESIFRTSNPDRGADAGVDALALRFDLTVPLARVVAQYRDLPRPFRRYQVAPVWRADKPAPGRFREFTQFDIDAVGAPSLLADVEIMAAMCDTLSALDVGPYRVRFSSRRILNLLLRFAEVPEEIAVENRVRTGPDTYDTRTERRPASDVFRVLDKLDKLGLERVTLELTRGYKEDESGNWIPGLGLSDEQVGRIHAFLGITADRRSEVLERLSSLFTGVPDAPAELDTVAQISDHLGALGYGDDRVAIDLSIARGLAYYTGPVFEAVLLDAPQFGSVFAGGRYDELVMRFLGQKIAATGASVGVDRLLAALLELKRVRLRRTQTRVLVTTMDRNLHRAYLQMTFELRRAGIPAEIYPANKPIGKQMKYADDQQIPIAAIVGEDEHKRGTVTLKDLDLGRQASEGIASREQWVTERPGQVEAPREQLVAKVREMLAAMGDDA